MIKKSICIISCTAHKRETPARAENLYCSELFYRSRRYAQARYDAWLILSAKHGLVRPSDNIAPYDCKLSTLSHHERERLIKRVAQQATSILPPHVEIDSI